MTETGDLAVRDRLLALIADRLGKEEDSRLVLKGGTLLRLCAFEHYRYSEDLDFAWLGRRRGFNRLFKAAAGDMQAAGAQHGLRVDVDRRRVAIGHRDGDEGRHSPIQVDVDFHRREHRRGLPPTVRWPIRDRYGQLAPGASIVGHTAESIASTKIVCVGARRMARDLYDLKQLIDAENVDMGAAWDIYLQQWKLNEKTMRQGNPRENVLLWRPQKHPYYLKGDLLSARSVQADKWAQDMPKLLEGDQGPGGEMRFDDAFDAVAEWVSEHHARYLEEYDGDPRADADDYQQIAGQYKERRAAVRQTKQKRHAKSAEQKRRAKRSKQKQAQSSGYCGYSLGGGRRCRRKVSGGGRCHNHRR